ncbi:MAG: hypothetical protein M1821_009643 [Bathelium mastoideum]|nr:MAG: hypothetical protein M1821_009643 [Bathelium mastoideum]
MPSDRGAGRILPENESTPDDDDDDDDDDTSESENDETFGLGTAITTNANNLELDHFSTPDSPSMSRYLNVSPISEIPLDFHWDQAQTSKPSNDTKNELMMLDPLLSSWAEHGNFPGLNNSNGSNFPAFSSNQLNYDDCWGSQSGTDPCTESSEHSKKYSTVGKITLELEDCDVDVMTQILGIIRTSGSKSKLEIVP